MAFCTAFFGKLLIRNSIFNLYIWTRRNRLLEMIMQKHKFASESSRCMWDQMTNVNLRWQNGCYAVYIKKEKPTEVENAVMETRDKNSCWHCFNETSIIEQESVKCSNISLPRSFCPVKCNEFKIRVFFSLPSRSLFFAVWQTKKALCRARGEAGGIRDPD